jgi:hypothetical protein
MRLIDLTEHRNTQTSFCKARKLRREKKDWFARRNFFVGAIDIGVFAKLARASLCDDQAAARSHLELTGQDLRAVAGLPQRVVSR